MRKEVIGDCELYLGDSLEVMPHLHDVDAVVTDPPYGIGFKYEGPYKDVGGEKYIEMLSYFNHLPCVILQYPEEMIELVVPAMGIPEKIVTWCYNSNTARQHRQWGFFRIKPDFSALRFPPKNPLDKRVSDSVSSYDWWSDIQQVKNVSEEKTDHPCQVPAELMRRILSIIPQAKTILDPFMGSGTTAVSAIKLGRRFFGIEINQDYFDIACKRIEKAYKQPDLFINQIKKSEQIDMVLND